MGEKCDERYFEFRGGKPTTLEYDEYSPFPLLIEEIVSINPRKGNPL